MSTVIKTPLVLLWLILLLCIGALGLLLTFFSGIYVVPLGLATLTAILAWFCLLFWLLCRKQPAGRHFRLATGVFFALTLLIPWGYESFVVNRYEVICEPLVDWKKFQPFTPDNGLVQAAPDAAFRFAGEPPRMSGASGSRRRTAHSTLSLREKS